MSGIASDFKGKTDKARLHIICAADEVIAQLHVQQLLKEASERKVDSVITRLEASKLGQNGENLTDKLCAASLFAQQLFYHANWTADQAAKLLAPLFDQADTGKLKLQHNLFLSIGKIKRGSKLDRQLSVNYPFVTVERLKSDIRNYREQLIEKILAQEGFELEEETHELLHSLLPEDPRLVAPRIADFSLYLGVKKKATATQCITFFGLSEHFDLAGYLKATINGAPAQALNPLLSHNMPSSGLAAFATLLRLTFTYLCQRSASSSPGGSFYVPSYAAFLNLPEYRQTSRHLFALPFARLSQSARLVHEAEKLIRREPKLAAGHISLLTRKLCTGLAHKN